MRIINVTTLDCFGKTTVPRELRKKWNALEGGKLVWYEDSGKIVIELVK